MHSGLTDNILPPLRIKSFFAPRARIGVAFTPCFTTANNVAGCDMDVALARGGLGMGALHANGVRA